MIEHPAQGAIGSRPVANAHGCDPACPVGVDTQHSGRPLGLGGSQRALGGEFGLLRLMHTQQRATDEQKSQHADHECQDEGAGIERCAGVVGCHDGARR